MPKRCKPDPLLEAEKASVIAGTHPDSKRRPDVPPLDMAIAKPSTNGGGYVRRRPSTTFKKET